MEPVLVSLFKGDNAKIRQFYSNVGEEEVFGRFCIRDVMENPSGGRISALQKSGFAPRQTGKVIC